VTQFARDAPWQAALLVVVCLLAGAAPGTLLVRAIGRRFASVWTTAAAIAVPLTVVVGVDARTALLGVWDAACVSLLFSTGFLFATHPRLVPDRGDVAIALGSISFSLLFVEAAVRLVLPPPPAFPAAGGVHLRLSEAIAASAVSMWEGGGKVTTCDAVYGPGAGGGVPWPGQFPRTWQPRPGARKRVLHLGDSMVFGSAVDGQFTANLDTLEPDVEHVNSAIGATAPDSYLALLWTWLSLHPPDLVVMHLTSNDLQELNQPYPCADWQPLLTYDGEPRLRFAEPHLGNLGRQRFRWLVHNSPPPYVLRVAVGFSHTAAFAAAAFVQLSHRFGLALPETDEDAHRPQLEAILRAARDELRRRGIPFVVNILPWRLQLEAPRKNVDEERWTATKMKRIAQSLGIDVLDASPEFEAAMSRGEQLFTNAGGPTDIHFDAAGHALMASFLHRELVRYELPVAR